MKPKLTPVTTYVFTGLLFSISLIYSCRKNDFTNENHKPGQIAYMDITDPEEMNTQLRIQAKTIAMLRVTETDFDLHGRNYLLAANDEHMETNLNMHDDYTNNYSIDYESLMLDNADYASLNETYDPQSFEGFDDGDDSYLTMVYGYEWDDNKDYNQDKLTIPDYYDASVEEVYGYFWDGSQIDSILVDEESIDDYYVWVVTARTAGEHPNASGSVTGEGTNCNCGNSICESAWPCEETLDPACVDCNGPTVHEKTLVLEEIQILKDEHPFRENFIRGKYDFAFELLIIDANGYIVSAARTPEDDSHSELKIKRKHVKRIKSNNSVVGTSTPKAVYHHISENFDPDTYKIILKIGEWDKFKGSNMNTEYFIVSGPANDSLRIASNEPLWGQGQPNGSFEIEAGSFVNDTYVYEDEEIKLTFKVY